MPHSPRQKYQWKTDNGLSAYGETDLEKKVVRINKKRHKSKRVQRISKKPNGEEHLGKTILHEQLHIDHPRMHERTVRKLEKGFDKLPKKAKKKLYARVK